MPKVNRRRNKSVSIRMNEMEYADLQNKVAKSGLSQQSFIINAVRGATIASADEVAMLKEFSRTFAEFERQLRGLGTNVNQMAHVANGQGELPRVELLKQIYIQITNYRKESEALWQSIRSSITQQRVMEL